MSVTVFIRYQIDPFKRARFEQYARRWLSVIAKCGGDLIGYFMPHEGTNNIPRGGLGSSTREARRGGGQALCIDFESLAADEAYRARLSGDAEGMANFDFAEEHKFVLAEERAFLRKVVA